MLSQEHSNINHRYYISNCSSLSDLEVAAKVVRSTGAKVVNKFWNSVPGGVAYISFDINKEKELEVIESLGRDNCY